MSKVGQFRRSVGIALWVALLAASPAGWSQVQSAPNLDPGFKSRAMAHVRQLAACGIRQAGSKEERKAARYITGQMKKAGLSVTNEPFAFQSFVLNDAVLQAGTRRVSILKLGFNPYMEASPISGDLVFLNRTDRASVLKADLEGKLVLISGEKEFTLVSVRKKPKALVSLSAHDFEQLRESGTGSGEIRFHGEFRLEKSANVVGLLGAKSAAREIILSAHYDSWNGPGANDNASGVAVLLELARYFHSLNLPADVCMRFVAFGGEEDGFLGSKAYLHRHQTRLQKCELLFNIDQVGGDGAIYTDTRGGIRNLPGKLESQLPEGLRDKAAQDTSDKWSLSISDEQALWSSSDVPEWLRSAVSKAGAGLGRKVIAGKSFGSDHRVFVQAGIVATDIAVAGGAQTHGPTDVPEAVDADSMQLAARLIETVIDNLVRSNLD